jgi:hypothetical protein
MELLIWELMEIGGRMLSQGLLALLVPAVIYNNSLCFGRTRKQVNGLIDTKYEFDLQLDAKLSSCGGWRYYFLMMPQ